MKIMYWFNREFTNFCHALSLELKKEGIEKFSGLVSGRKHYEFLKKQKEINYTHLKLAQDIFLKYRDEKIDYEYLNEIEKKYGDPWILLYSDRALTVYNKYKYKWEDYCKIIQIFFKEIEDLIKSAEPDYVIFDCIASFPAYVLYKVAKTHGVKTLIFTHTRVNKRITFSYDVFEGFNKIFDIFHKIRKGKKESRYKNDAINFLKEFRKKSLKPSYFGAPFKVFEERKSIKHIFKMASRYPLFLKNLYFGYHKNDYEFFGKNLFNTIFDEIIKLYRRFKIKHLDYYPMNRLKNEKCIFFPLHYEPELALSVKAPFYINQKCIIENISKALPLGYKLLVKDHPHMVMDALRSIKYYNKLTKIPGVFLISPWSDSIELIRHSKVVITITGTAGWEALLLKKPVITFGRVFYNKLSFVYRCKEIEKLPEIINVAINSHVHNENELIDFITAMFEGSFEADFTKLQLSTSMSSVLTSKDFKIISNEIKKEIGI